MKTKTPWLAVIDPIPFRGGSKVASAALLAELRGSNVDIEVFTRNPDFWANTPFTTHTLFESKAFEAAEQGVQYFLKHGLLTLQLIIHLMFRKKTSAIVGISGPGVDLCIYWCAKILRCNTIQLVHGPVANSRTIRKNFIRAKLVACLQSEIAAVKPLYVGDSPSRETALLPMINGIPNANWPTQCKNTFLTAHVFWAASLLKWKGLEQLLSAEISLRQHSPQARLSICYIRPCGTQQAVSTPPASQDLRAVYENPDNLDTLRAECNIFVSTSRCEPFGLSILEALAAGLCVVIPNDGAYWDQQLTHNLNCVKYCAGNSDSLALTLKTLANDMARAKVIASKGQQIAQHYRAAEQYSGIVKRMNHLVQPLTVNP